MNGLVAWVAAQPSAEAVWFPVLWVSFGLSGILLLGWAAYVMRELERGRQRYHEIGNDLNWLHGRLYFIEKKLGLETPPKRERKE